MLYRLRKGFAPGEAICAISRRRFGRRANNFGETPTGTGNMAPNRRESEPVIFGPRIITGGSILGP
jgi:hypothetical protein